MTESTIKQPTLSFLQIGDVHLPDCRNLRMVDSKDGGFPSALVDKIAPKRLEQVIRKLVGLIENDTEDKPAAILISGDLTSRGDLREYEECAKYLCQSMRLRDPAYWSEDQIHIVPGNHDVDRSAVSSADPIYDKFIPLSKVWESLKLPILTHSSQRHTTVSTNHGVADLFSVNSCLGCGAPDYLPGKIRSDLSKLLSTTSFDVKGMQLDTPAFDSTSLTSISDEINSLTATTIPIVVSHHNILPQAEPRLEIYTEAVNAGLVRSQLSQLNRPILYCHGHLHKDPIEIVSSPLSDKGRLICISAPLLSDGFNLITIQFARSKVPLGCIVRRFRLQNDCVVRELDPLRIPLWGWRDHVKLGIEEVACVMNKIQSEICRFANLLKKIRLPEGTPLEEETLTHILIELEWAGLVSISNRKEAPRHWQIQRCEP